MYMYITDVMCLNLAFFVVVQNRGDYILRCFTCTLISRMYKRNQRVFLPGSTLEQLPAFEKKEWLKTWGFCKEMYDVIQTFCRLKPSRQTLLEFVNVDAKSFPSLSDLLQLPIVTTGSEALLTGSEALKKWTIAHNKYLQKREHGQINTNQITELPPLMRLVLSFADDVLLLFLQGKIYNEHNPNEPVLFEIVFFVCIPKNTAQEQFNVGLKRGEYPQYSKDLLIAVALILRNAKGKYEQYDSLKSKNKHGEFYATYHQPNDEQKVPSRHKGQPGFLLALEECFHIKMYVLTQLKKYFPGCVFDA